ncbi:MAG: hypothetical protein R3B09_02275 [Nannocystaceae bacterium]
MTPRSFAALAFGALGLACQQQTGATSGLSTPTSTTDEGVSTADLTTSGGGSDGSSSGPTTSGTTTSTTSAPSSSSTTLLLDVGSDKDLGGGTPVGCKGKIDFLFVISRDVNMNVVQAQLVDAFPKFITTIESKFEDFDFHVMVVDTDEYWGIPWQCTPVCPDLSCKEGEPCCPYDYNPGTICCPVPDYPCGDLDLVTACDETLGAGVVFPAGKYASNHPCKVDSGLRYLTKGQSSLNDAFACIAQVGTGGWNESGAALAAAVAPEINAPGGCNDGFLRDDALLMVTMVTPSYDDSMTAVEEWYEAVVAAKHGDPGAIVMFLLNDPECPAGNRPCEFAKMFPYHHIADNDDADYGPAFNTAASQVATACAALVPG